MLTIAAITWDRLWTDEFWDNIIVERNKDAAVNQRIVNLLVVKGYVESYVEDENNMWYCWGLSRNLPKFESYKQLRQEKMICK